MHYSTRIAIVIFFSLLAGCAANPYAEFYRGDPDARKWTAYVPTDEPLRIYGTDQFDRDQREVMRRGYWPIGGASFNATSNSVTESQLRAQATKVGAQVVLVSSKYTGSVTGAVPLTFPQTTTSASSGTASAYGPGGTVTAYGTGTTTTRGSQTLMAPITIHRSDFGQCSSQRFSIALGS